jgi:hypothetical protein
MMEIDWNQAPKGARWWAMDADGHAFWYCSPDVKAFTTFWAADSIPAPDFGFNPVEWKTSLRERPAAST